MWKHYCCLVCKQKVSSVFIISCGWKIFSVPLPPRVWLLRAVTGVLISEWSCAKPNWLNQMFYHFMHQSRNCNVKQKQAVQWSLTLFFCTTWSILIVSVIMSRRHTVTDECVLPVWLSAGSSVVASEGRASSCCSSLLMAVTSSEMSKAAFVSSGGTTRKDRQTILSGSKSWVGGRNSLPSVNEPNTKNV